MPRDYDVIVVGAGPAGAACAIRAGRLGLRVLVLDGLKFPREKPCGDALSSASLACLKDLGLLSELLEETSIPVNAISYVSPDGESVTVPLLKLDSSLPVTAMICRRILLDDHLLEAARQVAEVRDWSRVRAVLTENGRACGVRAELGGGREEVFRAAAVVGADGARSTVARAMGVRAYPEYRALAVTAYYRLVMGTAGRLEAHFPREVLPGFLWINPTERGLTNVGLSLPLWRFGPQAPKPRRLLENALRSPPLGERFAYAEPFGRARVSILPLGNTLRQVHGEGFLLVGDAAGLIHPCSCEGVSSALISGLIAAEVLAEACARGDCGRKALQAYPTRLWKRLGPSLRLADRLLALRTPKAIGSLIRSARRRPHNAGWISGVLTGSALPSEELDAFLNYLDFLGR